ncbi:Tn3 family transposase [Streptomyces sp. NPDC002514]|uniref:Tn3 family transposase n=1 Tax=Streptomyces sp. NPDC001270 TaxID=3364554 RepID=UPI0036CFBB22
MTAATNKVESFNRFSQWIGFGNRGVIADNDPIEQEKAMKFNALLTNAVIFHNALDIAEIVRQLLEEGWEIDPEDLAHISPYLTEHINRFGEYSTHGLGIQPEAYDPKLDVDFTQLREQDRPDRRWPRPGGLTARAGGLPYRCTVSSTPWSPRPAHGPPSWPRPSGGTLRLKTSPRISPASNSRTGLTVNSARAVCTRPVGSARASPTPFPDGASLG